MDIVRDAAGLRPLLGGVLVPTMGALHEGHASLVRAAREPALQTGRPVVVSVFVNPTQFGPNEDFSRYPRTLDADIECCRRAGADAVFAPATSIMYPDGVDAREPSDAELPPVATEPGLEDRVRPGHFAGVCRVVRRLFELARPRFAVFGEKDYQQLCVIRAMVDLDGTGERILACPTIREADGLAMSSRNRYLESADRERAGALSKALCEACGQRTIRAAEESMRQALRGCGLEADYAVVRDAETLMAPRQGLPCRALVAARLGGVRLIDNAAWAPLSA